MNGSSEEPGEKRVGKLHLPVSNWRYPEWRSIKSGALAEPMGSGVLPVVM